MKKSYIAPEVRTIATSLTQLMAASGPQDEADLNRYNGVENEDGWSTIGTTTATSNTNGYTSSGKTNRGNRAKYHYNVWEDEL